MKTNKIPELSNHDIFRFTNKLNIRTDDECWEWTGGKDKRGYGFFWLQGRNFGAHRIAWYIRNRKQPSDMCICHRCDNPNCCNPAHLFMGSHRDNIIDSIMKGRAVNNKGENHGHSKLSNDEVKKIRMLYKIGYRQAHISEMFNIHQSAISRIINYKRWVHL